jgi:hypothetical protein
MATLMSPGDVRTFKRGGGNAVVVGLGLWAERQGKWIHIHMTGPDDSHTTVTNNPGSERYHRTLFRDLRRTLLRENCWEFGDEGMETEQKESLPRFDPVPIRGAALSATVISDRG